MANIDSLHVPESVREGKDTIFYTLRESLEAAAIELLNFGTETFSEAASSTLFGILALKTSAKVISQLRTNQRDKIFSHKGIQNRDIAWALSLAFQNAVRSMELEHRWEETGFYKQIALEDEALANAQVTLLLGLQETMPLYLFHTENDILENDIVSRMELGGGTEAAKRYLVTALDQHMLGSGSSVFENFLKEQLIELVPLWIENFMIVISDQEEPRSIRAFAVYRTLQVQRAVMELRSVLNEQIEHVDLGLQELLQRVTALETTVLALQRQMPLNESEIPRHVAIISQITADINTEQEKALILGDRKDPNSVDAWTGYEGATILYQARDYDEAIKRFQKSLELCAKTSNNRGVVLNCVRVAEILRIGGKIAEGEYLRRALNIAKGTKMPIANYIEARLDELPKEA